MKKTILIVIALLLHSIIVFCQTSTNNSYSSLDKNKFEIKANMSLNILPLFFLCLDYDINLSINNTKFIPKRNIISINNHYNAVITRYLPYLTDKYLITSSGDFYNTIFGMQLTKADVNNIDAHYKNNNDSYRYLRCIINPAIAALGVFGYAKYNSDEKSYQSLKEMYLGIGIGCTAYIIIENLVRTIFVSDIVTKYRNMGQQ